MEQPLCLLLIPVVGLCLLVSNHLYQGEVLPVDVLIVNKTVEVIVYAGASTLCDPTSNFLTVYMAVYNWSGKSPYDFHYYILLAC